VSGGLAWESILNDQQIEGSEVARDQLGVELAHGGVFTEYVRAPNPVAESADEFSTGQHSTSTALGDPESSRQAGRTPKSIARWDPQRF
jgi:hypothetical protein